MDTDVVCSVTIIHVFVVLAPEIISNKTYSEKCDVWSLGVIMFAL